MFKQETRLLLIIFIIILALAVLGVYFLQKQKSGAPAGHEEKKETLAEKQLKELDELRRKSGDRPLSQEEIERQLEELDKLRLAQ